MPTDPQLTFFIDNDLYVTDFNILAIPKVDLTRTPFTVSDYVETVSIGKIKRNFELFKRYRNVIIYKQQVKAMQPFSRHRWVLEWYPAPIHFSLSSAARKFWQLQYFEPVVIRRDYKTKRH